MPEQGFMTPAEQRAEAVAAEARLKARRDPRQLAGELTPDEAKATADSDGRLAVAVAANQAAVRAVREAQESVREPWKGTTLKEDEAIAEAERAVSRARRDEEDVRGGSVRLSLAIGAARAARREAADR